MRFLEGWRLGSICCLVMAGLVPAIPIREALPA
jgi:hypothetical protein